MQHIEFDKYVYMDLFNSLEHTYSCLDQFSAVDRILYTSNMDTLTKSFSDLCAVFQPKDLADVDYDAWATDIEKKP